VVNDTGSGCPMDAYSVIGRDLSSRSSLPTPRNRCRVVSITTARSVLVQWCRR
jgi:hypothetical protein